jgi:hypothetical protein
VSFDLLKRTADLDDAGLGGPGAPVVVIKLALAEPAAARATANFLVGDVVATDVLTDDQPATIDQGEKILAMLSGQQNLIHIVARESRVSTPDDAVDNDANA